VVDDAVMRYFTENDLRPLTDYPRDLESLIVPA